MAISRTALVSSMPSREAAPMRRRPPSMANQMRPVAAARIVEEPDQRVGGAFVVMAASPCFNTLRSL
jgi:hypothetical protein